METRITESFREEFGEALVELGRKNRRIVVLDADLAKSTRTILFAKEFPERFIELGISEQDLVGTAAGLAIAGKIPVVTTYSMFLLRAWEQIRNTVARDNLNVKFIVTHGGLSNHLDGSSHQCLEDIAVMRVIPNMHVIIPADTYATKVLMNQAIEINGPVYLRIGRDYAPRVYSGGEELRVGKTSLLLDGSDITLIACGVMVSFSLEAASRLKSKGLSVRVLDNHTLKPLDSDSIIKAAKETNGIITVEEHNVIGGLGGAVAETVSEKHPVRVKRMGVRDTFGTSSRNYLDLLKHYNLSVEAIVSEVEGMLRES